MFKHAMIFLVFLFFLSQTATAAELVIHISDSRNEKENAYLSELEISRDGKVFRILKPQYENKQVLKNIDLGTYTLVYKTLFNKEERVSVEIKEHRKYSVDVYINYLDYSKETHTPIIDLLEEKDSCVIFIESRGCFHFKDDTLIIKRNQDRYTLNWGDTCKTLSKADIEKIRHFEIELNYMMRGGCTTIDTYSIHYHGNQMLLISDGSCSWNGDYYLKQDLFGAH